MYVENSNAHFIFVFFYNIIRFRIRGLLLTMPSVIMNFGILIGFIGGEFLDYYKFPIIGIFCSTLFLCLFGFFPETPHFLFTRNRRERAIRSFRFYRGLKSFEDSQLEESFLGDFDNYKEHINDQKIEWNDFCKCIDIMQKINNCILLAYTYSLPDFSFLIWWTL